MAVLMQMKWEGVTPEQYDHARKLADMDNAPIKGLISHNAGFSSTAIHVNDVWESAEDLQHYMETRLMAATVASGMSGQPTVEIVPVHASLNQ